MRVTSPAQGVNVLIIQPGKVFGVEFGALANLHFTKIIGYTGRGFIVQQHLQLTDQYVKQILFVLLMYFFQLINSGLFAHLHVLIFLGALKQLLINYHTFGSARRLQRGILGISCLIAKDGPQ